MIRLALLAMALCAVPFFAIAQEGALTPRDYSPTDEVPIKVVSVAAGPIGTRIILNVGNRTDEPQTAAVECGLYDADGQAIGSESFLVEAVPPQSEAVQEINSFTDGAERAFCRITGFRTTN